MTDCSLCTLFADAGSLPLLIGRNDAAMATLHEDWAVEGHVMIVARDHVENVAGLSRESAASFLDLFVRVEAALIATLGLERVILLKLGLAVPHLHWHLYPFSREATRLEIFDAFNVKEASRPAEEEITRLVERLRAALT